MKELCELLGVSSARDYLAMNLPKSAREVPSRVAHRASLRDPRPQMRNLWVALFERRTDQGRGDGLLVRILMHNAQIAIVRGPSKMKCIKVFPTSDDLVQTRIRAEVVG